MEKNIGGGGEGGDKRVGGGFRKDPTDAEHDVELKKQVFWGKPD